MVAFRHLEIAVRRQSYLLLCGLYLFIFAMICIGVGLEDVGGLAAYGIASLLPLPILYGMHLVQCGLLTKFLGVRWESNAAIPSTTLQLLNTTCAAHKLTLPRIGVQPSRIPNAFVFGTRSNCRLVYTSGLLESLSVDEINAVTAHEIAHLRHNDIVILGIAVLVPAILRRMAIRLEAHNKSYGAEYLFFVLYFVTNMCCLKLTRIREFYADSFSAFLTGRPDALASTLIKLQSDALHVRRSLRNDLANGSTKAKKAARKEVYRLQPTAAFMFSSVSALAELPTYALGYSLRWQLCNRWCWFRNLFETHPTTAQRINALHSLAREMGLVSLYIESAERQGKVQFVVEALIYILPYLALSLVFLKVIPAAFIFLAAAALRTWYRYKGKAKPSKIEELFYRIDADTMCSIKVCLIGAVKSSDGLVIQDDTGVLPINTSSWSFIAKSRLDSLNGKTVKLTGCFRMDGRPFIEPLRVETPSAKICVRVRGLKYLLAVVVAFFALGFAAG